MNDQKTEYEIQRKREYHRRWRAEHPESVKAAQMRYWAKKAEEMRNASADENTIECRSTEE